MNAVFTQILAFVGKHWLRIGLVVMTIFLLTRKQIDLSVQLGTPTSPQLYHASPAPMPDVGSQNTPVPIDENYSSSSGESTRAQQLNVIGGSGSESNTHAALQVLRRIEEHQIQAFLNRFHPVAQTEQERYGIPASITLANGLLHSQGGMRPALNENFNFFGLPCTPDWRGQTHQSGQICLRAYPNAWTSFRDHSLFVTTGRFTQLTNLSGSDYRAWAAGIEQLGYPHTNNWGQQLLEVIEEYGLSRYDR